MKIKVFDLILWGLTILLGVGILMMPDTVPVHWNQNWEVDGYGSRYMYFILICIPIAVYYGMTLTKKIDPKKLNIEKRKKTYRLLQCGLTIFFLVLVAFFEYMIFNPGQDGQQFILLLMAILLIGMGNYLPKVPQNYFFGVKTPWTLASEYVWNRTHKISGYAFVILGLIIMLCAFIQFQYGYMVLMVGVILITVIIYVYSYYLFKQNSKNIDE